MIKEAYDAGVQQALFDIGITKVAAGDAGLMRRAWEAGESGLMRRAWEATKGAPGKAWDWASTRGLPAQYAMSGGAGALGGAGIGALVSDDAGEGALRGAGIGALGGLGARGGMHLMEQLQGYNAPGKGRLAGGWKHPGQEAKMRLQQLGSLAIDNPRTAMGAGIGLGGAAGLGAGAGLNALMD